MMSHPTTISPDHDSQNCDHTPTNNSQDGNITVTFKQVLRHWCCIDTINSTSCSSTLFHTWFAQNVYPLVTIKRIFFFVLSQICFILAYGFFCQTNLYKSCIYGDDRDHERRNVVLRARPLVFLATAFGVHTMCLIFLLFFSFCCVSLEKYKYHYLMKSLGEYLVKILVVLLIVQIVDGANANNAPTTSVEYSEVAGLVTWCLLSIDALCFIGLSNHAHCYSLFEAMVTLTLHLGLDKDNYYCRIPASIFVFVIVVIKNFMGKKIDHPQITPELRPVAWVAPEVV